MMITAFLDKLACRVTLDAATERWLEASVTEVFTVERGRMSKLPGPGDAFVIVDGLACRCRILPDHGRQVTTLHIPGDVLGPIHRLPGQVAGSIEALSACRLARIPRGIFDAMASDHAMLAFALQEMVSAEEAALCERLVSLGRRSSRGRLAHLLCELLVRHRAAGRTLGNGFDLPVERRDLADALGLSVLNLGRVLQSLGDDALVRWDVSWLEILDVARLEAEAGFDATYLRVGRGAETAMLMERERVSA